MTIRGPWYLSARAVRDYLVLTGRDPKDEDAFASGEDELAELVRRAQFVRTQDNGLQQWRLTGTPRLRLLVSTRARPEGNLPQLVRVLPKHAGGRGA
ncbi:MAG: hypothetical protein JW940_29765 [Polyangiaceae bacterium]|nr:hypothetical protein [Polyangiaceae bacterium]